MRTGLAVAVLVAALTLGTAGGALAQTDQSATVGLDADDQELEEGETTTVRVVVSNASAGVGSLAASVSVGNRDVIEITNVTIDGDAGVATVGRDGEVATASTSGLEASGESVTVATLTVRGVSPGQADIALSGTRLGASDGGTYAVEATNTTVSITPEGGSDALAGLAVGLGIIGVALVSICVYHIRNR